MKKEIRYELEGFMIGTDWYGHKGANHLLIKTDQQGLEKIKKEPLQDYIQFGLQSVDYVELRVYRIEKYERKGYRITKETTEPTEEIIAGEFDLTEEEQDTLMELLLEPPDVIHYK